jgi:hypothetical protein
MNICPTCHRALFRNSMTVDEAAKSCPNTDAPGCLRFALQAKNALIRQIENQAGNGLLKYPEASLEEILNLCQRAT